MLLPDLSVCSFKLDGTSEPPKKQTPQTPTHHHRHHPRTFQKPCLWVTEKSQPGTARMFQRAVAVCVLPSEAEEVASPLNGEREGKKRKKNKEKRRKRKGRRVKEKDFTFSRQTAALATINL